MDETRKARREIHRIHQNFLAAVGRQSMRRDGRDGFLRAQSVGYHQCAGEEKGKYENSFHVRDSCLHWGISLTLTLGFRWITEKVHNANMR
jgi:hypothetical protein